MPNWYCYCYHIQLQFKFGGVPKSLKRHKEIPKHYIAPVWRTCFDIPLYNKTQSYQFDMIGVSNVYLIPTQMMKYDFGHFELNSYRLFE